ncbi:hypothetical protein E2C01_075641 [Portunus trituberculatus]|uniref:Uncharacterized protein n=1 Tax=Portunus trituberculatus TaxID=210409 RepID=A0A5B7IB77_PORTR|nr:hypothetical protein [Portunus trituberculatus]
MPFLDGDPPAPSRLPDSRLLLLSPAGAEGRGCLDPATEHNLPLSGHKKRMETACESKPRDPGHWHTLARLPTSGAIRDSFPCAAMTLTVVDRSTARPDARPGEGDARRTAAGRNVLASIVFTTRNKQTKALTGL